MKQCLFYCKIHNATIFVLLVMIAISFSIVPSSSVGSATTEVYDNGYEHGCDDAGIVNPSDRYINQPGKGPSFHTNEFMDGYYTGFYECSNDGLLRQQLNMTRPDCPDNYYGDGNTLDLLDRSWC
jgi:hypothetical protein